MLIPLGESDPLPTTEALDLPGQVPTSRPHLKLEHAILVEQSWYLALDAESSLLSPDPQVKAS